MSDLKDLLVKLGSKRPDLRRHIRPILNHLDYSSSVESARGVEKEIIKNRILKLPEYDSNFRILDVENLGQKHNRPPSPGRWKIVLSYEDDMGSSGEVEVRVDDKGAHIVRAPTGVGRGEVAKNPKEVTELIYQALGFQPPR